jgi:hypothetical protein
MLRIIHFEIVQNVINDIRMESEQLFDMLDEARDYKNQFVQNIGPISLAPHHLETTTSKHKRTPS